MITFLWESAEAIPQSLARVPFLLSSKAERTKPSEGRKIMDKQIQSNNKWKGMQLINDKLLSHIRQKQQSSS